MSAAIVEMKFDEYKRREDELAALRARVAKLEEALKFYAEDCGSYARAALKDAPQ